MANYISWDIDEMERYTVNIERHINELEEKKKYLMNIDKSIELVFQGGAGAVFDAQLDFDIIQYGEMIEKMKKLNEAVKKAIREHYSTAENSIKSKITSLASSVR